MKTFFLTAFFSVLLSGLLLGAPSAARADDPLRVIVLLETDSRDLGPLDSLRHGLAALHEQGNIDISIRSATTYPEQKVLFHEAASKAYDVVIVASPIFHTLLNNNAGNYRRQNFLCLDADITAPNIVSIVFADVQSAYLCGVAAAMLLHSLPILPEHTSSIPLALVGSESLAQEAMHKAFQRGVQETYAALVTEKNIQFSQHTLPMSATKEEGHALARRIALDIKSPLIFSTFTGGAALGIHEAALNTDTYIIGMDQQRNKIAPSAESFSLKKNMGKAAADMLLHIKEHGFPVGQIQEKTVRDTIVGIIASYHNIRPTIAQAIAARLEQVTEELKAGRIVLEGPRGLCQCF